MTKKKETKKDTKKEPEKPKVIDDKVLEAFMKLAKKPNLDPKKKK